MDKLRSWTETEETRYFSGVATYERTITVPDVLLQNHAEVRLDFGEGEQISAQQLKNGMRAFWEGPVREGAWIVAFAQGLLALVVVAIPVTLFFTFLIAVVLLLVLLMRLLGERSRG